VKYLNNAPFSSHPANKNYRQNYPFRDKFAEALEAEALEAEKHVRVGDWIWSLDCVLGERYRHLQVREVEIYRFNAIASDGWNDFFPHCAEGKTWRRCDT